jgi:hypothetical protein
MSTRLTNGDIRTTSFTWVTAGEFTGFAGVVDVGDEVTSRLPVHSNALAAGAAGGGVLLAALFSGARR